MKFKILSIIMLPSFVYGSASSSSSIGCCDYEDTSSSSSSRSSAAYTKQAAKPAEIYSLEEAVAKDTCETLSTIDTQFKYLQARIKKTYDYLECYVGALCAKNILRRIRCRKIPRMVKDLKLNYVRDKNLLLKKIHFLRNCVSQYPEIDVDTTNYPSNITFVRRLVVLLGDHTKKNEQEIAGVPEKIETIFKHGIPTLYKAVEEIIPSQFEGRLAGVALYYNWRTISIALGRKGLATAGDDPDIHVERELSSKLIGDFSGHGGHHTGHLFVYCPYAPCNKVKDSGKIPCLQFYHNLVQENPGLNVTVFFHKPFKTGGDFWSRTPHLTLFDLSTNTQFTEPLPTINLSLLTSGAPALLQRARSDEIVDCLLRIPSNSLLHIVKKMKISDERRDRIQKKLLEAETAAKKKKTNKRRKMRSRAK